jgi:3-hydroxybutyryl-CoA dehydrogenase
MSASLVVVGAGTMGRGIAGVALASRLRTTLVDVDESALAAARDAIARRLERDRVGELVSALSLTTELEAAVADAGTVVEAVPEIADLKADILTRAARAAPEAALLVTNTSTLSISELAHACGDAPRLIGMHFFNPVHRMALVEVIVGEATSQPAVADALALAATLGKDPVVVRDAPGFVTSRLGLLLGNEAMRMVEEGVASAADIDKAMRLGYGHPMGPLELADLVGLDARLNNVRSMHAQSGRELYEPPEILTRLVEGGRLGRKSGSGFYRYDDDGKPLGPAQDAS